MSRHWCSQKTAYERSNADSESRGEIKVELHRKQSLLRWEWVMRNFKTPIFSKTQSWEGSSLFVCTFFKTLVTKKNKTKKHINTKGIQPQTPCPLKERERKKKKNKSNPFSLSVDSDVTNYRTWIYIYVYTQYTPPSPLSKIHGALMLSWLQLTQVLYFLYFISFLGGISFRIFKTTQQQHSICKEWTKRFV